MQVTDVGPIPITYSLLTRNILVSITMEGVPNEFPILCRTVLVGPGTPDASDLRGVTKDATSSIAVVAGRDTSVACPLPPVLPSSARNVTGYDLFISANGYNWFYTGRLGLVSPPIVAIVRPSIGPVGQKLQLHVSGSAFLQTSRIQCSFSLLNGTSYLQVYSNRAEYVNSSFLQCSTPRAAELNWSTLDEIRAAFAGGMLLSFKVDVSLNGRDPGLAAQDSAGQNMFYGYAEPDGFAVIPREAAIKESGSAAPVFQAFNVSLFGVSLGYSSVQVPTRLWARLTYPSFCADSNYSPCWQRISSVFPGGLNRTRVFVRIAEAPIMPAEHRARLGLEFSLDSGANVNRMQQTLTVYYTPGTPPIASVYPGLPGGGTQPACRTNGGICGAGICGSIPTLTMDICLCFHAQVCSACFVNDCSKILIESSR
jgi:hypothetical protein